MSIHNAGTLKLRGDWQYVPGKGDISVSTKKVNEMREFFREYKILFAAVLEKVLPPDSLYDYFRGTITFDELLEEFEFYEDLEARIKQFNQNNGIKTLLDLYTFVKKNDSFNTWD